MAWQARQLALSGNLSINHKFTELLWRRREVKQFIFLHIYIFLCCKVGYFNMEVYGDWLKFGALPQGALRETAAFVLALLFSFRDDPLVLLHVKMNFIGLVDCEGLRKPVWSEHRKGHNNPPTNVDFKMFNGKLSNRKKRQSQLVY